MMIAALFLFLVIGEGRLRSALSMSSTSHAKSFWRPRARADLTKRYNVSLVLYARDYDGLFNVFLRSSDPTHAEFGQRPSDECSFVTRESESAALVRFLEQKGLSCSFNRCRDVLGCSASGATFERAFSLQLFEYEHKDSPAFQIIATESDPVLDAPFGRLVQVFHGFHFPALASHKIQQKSTKKRASYADATPPILRKLYNISDGPVSGTQASQAVAGWQHQSFSNGDLGKFQEEYGLPKQGMRKIYGTNTGWPHMESNLDTQYITGIGSGIPTDFFLNSGFSFDVLDWIVAVDNETSPALVWSVSYGENLDMKTAAYAQAVNQKMQQLALRGCSIFVASGDTGAKSRQGFGFAPEFPAVLPGCTAVGATVLNENLTETSAVSCDYGWCSGGGFSFPTYFALNTSAPWQQAAVQNYLATATLPPSKDWETMKGGVGFPDIAGIGTNHEIYYYRFKTGVAGTSSSCPSTAAMFSLLNDQRLRAGKKPLGFLNQIIYKNPHLFNDIVIGNTGWFAAPGWDATTGMGSPKYGELRAYVLSLP